MALSDNITTKKCSKCHTFKPFSMFCLRKKDSKGGKKGCNLSAAVEGSSLEQTTRDDLTARGLAATPLGVSAIGLAREIDGFGRAGSRDGLSALASAHRAFADVLDKVGPGKTAGDRGDELAEQREKRRRAAQGE